MYTRLDRTGTVRLPKEPKASPEFLKVRDYIPNYLAKKFLSDAAKKDQLDMYREVVRSVQMP